MEAEFSFSRICYYKYNKIFNKYKFKGWYLERILHESGIFGRESSIELVLYKPCKHGIHQ